MNTVTSPFMAIVDGKSTGLSGCNGGCSGCLRADPQLADVRIARKMQRKAPTNRET